MVVFGVCEPRMLWKCDTARLPISSGEVASNPLMLIIMVIELFSLAKRSFSTAKLVEDG